MNLSDIKEEGLLLKKDLESISKVITMLSENKEETTKWIENALEMLINNDIVGGANAAIINNAQGLKQNTNIYYKNLIQSLRNIDFSDSLFSLASLENRYHSFNIDDFIKKYREFYKIIHEFIRVPSNAESTKLFKNTYIETDNIINEFRILNNKIDNIEAVYNDLAGNSNENILKIRLLNEDNNISTLINNMKIINSLYDALNEILGCEKHKLKYKRAESGTFEIDLIGSIKTLAVLVPTLTFMYKIYSDNFSWKAKQDKQLGEIKVRREILALIKEKEELKVDDNNLIQNCLADIELNGRKLFINNPRIKLNNEEIGLSEETANNIDRAYLESQLPRIDCKEIALDKEQDIEK